MIMTETSRHPARARSLAALLMLALALGTLPPSAGRAMSAAPSPYAGVTPLIPSEAARDPSDVRSVAISADGATIVVGAPHTDNGDADLGTIYIFERRGPSWSSAVEVAILTASDGGTRDMLGWSVAVSADGGVVAAGAPGAEAVYVFTRPRRGWLTANETAALRGASDAPSSGLGASVAITADGATIVAGAPEAGAGYVFARPAGGWSGGTETARLSATGGPDARLGEAVAISADGATIALGAPGAGLGGPERGAVLVFGRPAVSWTGDAEHTVLAASDAADGDRLGAGVAISANGDTLAAGAPGAGAAYVFTRPLSGWAGGRETARLSASDAGGQQGFGAAIATNASAEAVAVGAGEAVYVFGRPASGWASATERARLAVTHRAQGDARVSPLALSGSGLALVAGASAGDAGAAQVFEAAAPSLRLAAHSCLADGTGGVFALETQAGDSVLVRSLNQSLVPDSQIVIAADGPGRHLVTIGVAGRRAGGARLLVSAGTGLTTVSRPITVRTAAPAGSILSGTAGSDLLIGGEGSDTLLGRDGPDMLCGRGGADTLLGGAGADVLGGHGGRDILQGGDGDDTLAGGPDADLFRGGSGLDVAIDYSPAQGDTSDGTVP